MDLQEQLEVGHQAEDFKQYIDEHPYFKGLLTRIELEMSRQILSLSPKDTDAFTEMKAEMNGVGQIMNAISGDIYMGQQAYEKLNGLSEEPKGLL